MTIRVAGISALYPRFELHCLAEGLSPQTIDRYYHRCLTRFLTFLGDQEMVMSEDLTRYLARCRATGCSPFTVRSYYGAIRRVFSWLAESGLIEGDPFTGVKPPRLPRRERELPPDQAIDRLLGAASRLRDRAIVLVTLDGNLRLNEVRTLSMTRVHLTSRVVVVQGKGSKERGVVLGPRAFQTLLAYLDKERPDSDSDRVFLAIQGEPLSVRGFQQIFARLRTKAGVQFRYHDLRHLGATQDARAGMGAFELMTKLGHTTLGQTLHYLHLAGRDGGDGPTAADVYRRRR